MKIHSIKCHSIQTSYLLIAELLDFQEYIGSKQANQVRSLMYMIDMLMSETLTKEDANENKHVRNYAMVRQL